MVLGMFYLSRYYKFELDRKYDTSYVERYFTKVMTYNVLEGKSEELPAYFAKHNPDILCLQEMVDLPNLELLCDKYNTTKRDGDGVGNQIFTRYKIIRSGEIKGVHRRNGVWADLRVKDDTVRVVALHLQSTAIRPEDTHFIEGHQFLVDSLRDERLRSIVARLVENNRKRAEQAEAIAQFLEVSPHKTIVCGDFNDVPLSYTYNTITEGVVDTFSQMADGFAYTYNTLYGLLRIDNILVSPTIEVVSYEVDKKAKFSDHFPVVVRVKFNKTL